MIPQYVNDVLDRGYEYVKATGRNPIQLANNNRPSQTLIREAVKEFQDIASCNDVRAYASGEIPLI